MTHNLRSMTGFGSTVREAEGLRVRADVRAVNQRGLKINIRSRPYLGVLEERARKCISAVISRGHVEINIDVTSTGAASERLVDMEAAANIVSAVRALAEKVGITGDLNTGDLLRIPGLFANENADTLNEEDWPVVEAALNESLAQADSMRAAEGQSLAGVLAAHAGQLQKFRDEAEKVAPGIPERLRQRLTERLNEVRDSVPDTLDQQAIEREVAFFADRADITEELDRLTSHLDQFHQALSAQGECGKRLEFLAQEFLREVNTIASKANDTAITTQAVDAKLAVEKIKEQVANIE